MHYYRSLLSPILPDSDNYRPVYLQSYKALFSDHQKSVTFLLLSCPVFLPLGNTQYILWSTCPPMCWHCARQEKQQLGFQFFFNNIFHFFIWSPTMSKNPCWDPLTIRYTECCLTIYTLVRNHPGLSPAMEKGAIKHGKKGGLKDITCYLYHTWPWWDNKYANFELFYLDLFSLK